jgi:N-acetyl-gamma-glutamyl-phosphate reductase
MNFNSKEILSSSLILVSVIDNLGKGAAGQAVQNANIRFGLDPALGLGTLAAYP